MIPSHITTCVFGEVGCATTFTVLTEAKVHFNPTLAHMQAGKILIVRSKNTRDP